MEITGSAVDDPIFCNRVMGNAIFCVQMAQNALFLVRLATNSSDKMQFYRDRFNGMLKFYVRMAQISRKRYADDNSIG